MKRFKLFFLITSLVVLVSSLSGCGTGRLFHGPYGWGHGHHYHQGYYHDPESRPYDDEIRRYDETRRHNDAWFWR